MKKVFFMFIALVAMTACSSVDEPAKMADTDNASVSAKFLTEDEAVKVAQSALVDFGFSKPSRSNRKANVSVYRSHASRGAESDTAFYIVNFTNGGFAVVAADKTIDKPVFGVGPGQFEVSPDNGTSDYMEAVCDYICNPTIPRPGTRPGPLPLQPADSIPSGVIIEGDFGNYFQMNLQYSYTKTVIKDTNTEWDQEAPYNDYCPLDRTNGMDCPTGCVPLAIGQLMTYYRKPTSLQGVYFDWDVMLSSRKITLSSPFAQKDMAARMLYLIGESVGTDYKYNSSGTEKTKACEFFQSHGYSDAHFSTGGFTEQLENHGPFYMRADSYAGSGHAWVVDGYRHEHEVYDEYNSKRQLVGGYTKDTRYYRMNWGWNGHSNGFFKYIDGIETTLKSGQKITFYYFEGIVGLTK